MKGNQPKAATAEEEATRLGAFLRAEREKMKLSQEEIAQKMRLRRSVVEAIENEEWDRLPPPVFVKGFVRSYARTLELDEKRALELYQRAAPPATDTLRAIAVPRSSHRAVLLVIPAILAVLLCLFYFWHLKSSGRDREYLAMVERAAPVQREESPAVGTEKTVTHAVPPALPGPTAPATSGLVAPGKPYSAVPSTPAPEERSVASQEKAQAQVPPERDSARATASPPPALVLRGEVKERTWVSIRVDGDEPKEYIFQPGAKPQWKALRGFEIVIGNAAGMDFDFDGKTIENLGRSGQVVRLRLPKDYQ